MFKLSQPTPIKVPGIGEPTGLSFSPDSRFLATIHDNGSAWILDFSSGEVQMMIEPEIAGRFPTAVAFSDDSREVA